MPNATDGNNNPEHLRMEPRFRSNGRTLVTVLGALAYGKYAATTVDVSLSGLQLELNTPLPKGIQVKVEFSDMTVIGEVQNMRSDGVGHYRAGIFIIMSVWPPARPERVVPDWVTTAACLFRRARGPSISSPRAFNGAPVSKTTDIQIH